MCVCVMANLCRVGWGCVGVSTVILFVRIPILICVSSVQIGAAENILNKFIRMLTSGSYVCI